MTAFSDKFEADIRDHLMRDTQVPLYDTYLALFTADPTDTGSTANEVSGGAYARQQVHQATTTTPYWTNATGGTGIENNQEVAFPQATASWGTVTHMAVMTGSTGTGMLLHTSLNTSKSVATNDTARFQSGSASFTFD